jgi:hypothetical protein
MILSRCKKFQNFYDFAVKNSPSKRQIFQKFTGICILILSQFDWQTKYAPINFLVFTKNSFIATHLFLVWSIHSIKGCDGN